MHIVVGSDLSEGSASALRWAFAYAARHEGTEVTVLHSVEAQYPRFIEGPSPLQSSETLEKLRDDVREWVETTADATDVDYDIAVESGRAEETLESTVEETGADWIGVGMTGRGALERFVVGSTAERLAHSPPANLAICHPDGFPWDETPELLLGVDFTDASRRAVALAGDLARRTGARLHIVHVVPPPTYESYPFDAFEAAEVDDMSDLVDWLDRELDDFLAEQEEALRDVDWMSETSAGYPTEELTDYAESHDIAGIVLGTAGRSAIGNFLMGSVTRGVVKHMPCNVFLSTPSNVD